MPSLGADMETGKVVQWLVKPGDRVKPGDVVAVVETHKGAIDVEIFLDGVIDQLAALDQDMPVGAVLAQVRPQGQGSPDAPARAEGPAPERRGVGAPMVEPGGQRALPVSAVPVSPPPQIGPPVRARVSPAARQRARALDLSPDALPGSGVGGMVSLRDVDRAAAQAQPAPDRAATAAAAPHTHAGGFDTAQMRQAIAAAMSRSKREIPHYYLSDSIDFTAARDWLEVWNRERVPEQRLLGAVLLLKATARALCEVPQLNGFYENGAFRAASGIHIGWAIALRGGGLVAPAIHDADRVSLSELMVALSDLVQRARTGRLRSSELTDPTITVTSLGERGAQSVLGVIYPPQVAIVGFGRVVQLPWVVDGQVQVRPVVNVTLAADHRASDGHLGGRLLAAIERALQSPQDL